MSSLFMLKTLLNAGFSGNNDPIPTHRTASSTARHKSSYHLNEQDLGQNPLLKIGKLTPQSTRSEASS
ncbi:hypothetical protein [Nostoc sp.]|uniref:hypothetical protein n=1 Tax=Nostoc sp. TaxID=1180 RepID=UPI002FF44D5C